jgi:hypothetical protein
MIGAVDHREPSPSRGVYHLYRYVDEGVLVEEPGLKEWVDVQIQPVAPEGPAGPEIAQGPLGQVGVGEVVPGIGLSSARVTARLDTFGGRCAPGQSAGQENDQGKWFHGAGCRPGSMVC